jgi:hypothetical protein
MAYTRNCVVVILLLLPDDAFGEKKATPLDPRIVQSAATGSGKILWRRAPPVGSMAWSDPSLPVAYKTVPSGDNNNPLPTPGMDRPRPRCHSVSVLSHTHEKKGDGGERVVLVGGNWKSEASFLVARSRLETGTYVPGAARYSTRTGFAAFC